MGRDASLSEFLGGEGADEGDEGGPTEGEASAAEQPTADGADDSAKPTGGEDATTGPTADWSPDGAACDDCGAAVERRWRQGEGMVCGNCKRW